MTRTVNVDTEYRCGTQKALDKFFKKHPELEFDWRDALEWMAETGTEHFINDIGGDGSKIEWTFSLWLYTEEKYTYIAIIERA